MIQVLYLLEEHWSLCVHYHDQLEEIIVWSALTCAHFGMDLDNMKWTTSFILCQVRPQPGVPAITKI